MQLQSFRRIPWNIDLCLEGRGWGLQISSFLERLLSSNFLSKIEVISFEHSRHETIVSQCPFSIVSDSVHSLSYACMIVCRSRYLARWTSFPHPLRTNGGWRTHVTMVIFDQYHD